MTTANEALAPCPFCEAKLVESPAWIEHPYVEIDGTECPLNDYGRPNEPAWRKAWNTRALSAPPPAVAPQGWQPMDIVEILMREPSAAMRNAGADTFGLHTPHIGPLPIEVIDGQPSKAWAAMAIQLLVDLGLRPPIPPANAPEVPGQSAEEPAVTISRDLALRLSYFRAEDGDDTQALKELKAALTTSSPAGQGEAEWRAIIAKWRSDYDALAVKYAQAMEALQRCGGSIVRAK